MAFNSNVPRAEYIAATGQTVFPFVFKIFEQTDVKVYLTPNGQISDDATDLLQSGYTVSVNGDAGGSVTLSSATTTGDKITLLRNLPVVRNTDYQENGDLRASTLDSDQDYQTYLVGDLSSKIDKVVKFPESAQGLDGTLPSPSPENYIRWNSTGTALENDTTMPSAVSQAEVSATIATTQAGIATIKAGEASTSASNALASEVQAGVYAGMIAISVDTIENMTAISLPQIGQTTIVRDENRGGMFIYRPTGVANGGTIFDSSSTGKWCRQYDGAVNVKWFGAKGDGATDDTLAIQNAINYVGITHSSLLFPITSNGDYKISSQLVITNACNIIGENYFRCRIVSYGCSALLFVGVTTNSSKIADIEIVSSIRYTDVVNTYTGIEFAGVAGVGISDIIMTNVYIDGYETAIKANNLYTSRIENIASNFVKIGIVTNGLSVNNVITGCKLLSSNIIGSKGIILGDGITPTEGVIITECIFYRFDYGIYGSASSNNIISHNIIDFNTKHGIVFTNTSEANNIFNNYIAMTGTATSGITLYRDNDGSTSIGDSIVGNTILVYSGSTGSYGIELAGGKIKNSIISENRISGFSQNDIYSLGNSANNTITNNICTSSVANNIFSNGGGIITDNIGTVYYTTYNTKTKLGMLTRTYAEAIPISGTWARGDIIYTTVPSAGGYIGWVCTTAGTPGTWKTFGAITA